MVWLLDRLRRLWPVLPRQRSRTSVVVRSEAPGVLQLLTAPGRRGQMDQERGVNSTAPPAPVHRFEEPPWWVLSPPREFAVEGTNRCGWCGGVFDRTRRSLAEVEALRRVLRIEMTTPFDPSVCDGCIYGVTASAVPPDIIAGDKPPVSSGGVVNMALWMSAREPEAG